MLTALKPVCGLTAAGIAKAIGESVEHFMGTAPAADDITLVVARKL